MGGGLATLMDTQCSEAGTVGKGGRTTFVGAEGKAVARDKREVREARKKRPRR